MKGGRLEWKGINCKQSTRWQHLSRLKASAFFSLQKKVYSYKTQQLIIWTGTAIWWVTEPHWVGMGISVVYNRTARFKNCKQLFEYQYLILFRDIWWSKFLSIFKCSLFFQHQC